MKDFLLSSLKDWSFYIQLLVCSFSIVSLLGNDDLKSDYKKRILNLFIVFLACMASDVIFSILSVYFDLFKGINFTISYLLVIVIYVVFVCKHSTSSKVIMLSTSFTLICTIIELSTQLMMLFENNYGGSFTFVRAIGYAFIIIFTMIAKRHSVNSFSNIPNLSFIIILIQSIIINGFIIYREKTQLGQGLDNFLLVSLIFFYMFSLFSYLLVYLSAKEHSIRFQVEIEKKLLESDKQQLVVSQQAIDEMRGIRHDIKNQYAIIQTLLSEGKIEELSEYMDNISKEPILLHNFVHSGNKTIDSVLNMEKIKASSYGFQIRIDAIVPSKMIITISDISRILVNLIDNAIEELQRNNSKNGVIDVKICTRAQSLYICVKNPLMHSVLENDLSDLNTSKQDNINHGLGHKIVARIVGKYNGYIEYSIENEYFLSEVLLSLKGEN